MPYPWGKAFASLTLLFFYIVYLQVCPCAGQGVDRIELIDKQGAFINTTEIDSALARWNLSNVGRDYFIVGAVEGLQSNEKSTTLNKVFKTQSDVMDTSQRKQTAMPGVWMAIVKGTKIIVLDAEGLNSDSERYGEGDASAKRKTLAFMLAHANVLVITIWKNQIPLHSDGASLPLLQAIVEHDLRFSSHNSVEDISTTKKVLLFLIQDDDGQTPFAQLRCLIRAKVEEIWKDIQHNGRSVDDCFVLDFYFLPNYIYRQEEYGVAVLGLQNRLYGPEGLLTGLSSTNIPIRGLSTYMRENYLAIQDDKALNLSSQRQVVMEYRMNEVMKEVLDWLGNEIKETWRAMGAEGNQRLGFGRALRKLYESSLDRWAYGTDGFSASTYEKRSQDFTRSTLEVLKRAYHKHIHELKHTLQDAYSAELSTLTSPREFINKHAESKAEKLAIFKRAQNEALRLDSDWIDVKLQKDLSRHLDEICNAAQLSSRLEPTSHSRIAKIGHAEYMEGKAQLLGGGTLVFEVYTQIERL